MKEIMRRITKAIKEEYKNTYTIQKEVLSDKERFGFFGTTVCIIMSLGLFAVSSTYELTRIFKTI